MTLRISVQSIGFSVASLTFEVASTFAWVVSGLNSCSEFILVLDNEVRLSMSRFSSRRDGQRCSTVMVEDNTSLNKIIMPATFICHA